MTGADLGLLLLETLTGLSIYLLSFSVFNQFCVLWHTVLGVLMIGPSGWYLGRHWWLRFRGNFNHYQLLGNVSAAALLLLVVTGVVLTVQAWFGTRIGRIWDQLHIVATFVFVLALGAHLATLIARRVSLAAAGTRLRQAQWTALLHTLAWTTGGLGLCAVCALGYREPMLSDALPADYSFRYGADRPFAPSLARKDMTDVEDTLRRRILAALGEPDARTFLAAYEINPLRHEGLIGVAERLCASMQLDDAARREISAALADARRAFTERGGIHPRRLAGSSGCGSNGCHSEIYQEWLPSAHRYAPMDFVFQKVQENMSREKAPEATRYCAGCHDPIALFSGVKKRRQSDAQRRRRRRGRLLPDLSQYRADQRARQRRLHHSPDFALRI